MHELSLAGAIQETAVRHAEGRPVRSVQMRIGRLRQVVPGLAALLLRRSSPSDTLSEGAALELELVDALLRCGGLRPRVGPGAGARRGRARPAAAADVPLPGVRGRRRRGDPRRGVRGRVDRGRGGRTRRATPSRTRRAQRRRDASHQGQGHGGRARRQHDDRARPTAPTSTATASRVVNLMSAPGAGKTTLLEAALPGPRAQGRGARGRRAGQHRRGPAGRAAHPGDPAQHRQRLRRRLPPRREHGPHRAARPAARRDRPAGGGERRQPRLPGRVPDRRGREGDGLLGHRGRGQAAQVPADVPHLRAGRGQQGRPARAPRLRPRQVPLQRRRGQPGRRDDAAQRQDRRGCRGVPLVARRRSPSGEGPRRAPQPEPEHGAERGSSGSARPGRRPARAPPRGEPPLLRRRGRAPRAALPPDGRALRARRAAGRAGRLARGALRRPPRHRRVRPPGDRRQAGAAGDRALRARAGRSPRRWT